MVPRLMLIFSRFGGAIDVKYSLRGNWFRRGRNRVVVPTFHGRVIGARVWIDKGGRISRRDGPALEMDDGQKRWQKLDDQGTRI